MARCDECGKRRVLDANRLCTECRAEFFRGAMCSRCEISLSDEGYCPNDRCPFHTSYQDEGIANDQWPSEEEWLYIEQLRERMRRKQ